MAAIACSKDCQSRYVVMCLFLKGPATGRCSEGSAKERGKKRRRTRRKRRKREERMVVTTFELRIIECEVNRAVTGTVDRAKRGSMILSKEEDGSTGHRPAVT